jgi:hypothetical protein
MNINNLYFFDANRRESQDSMRMKGYRNPASTRSLTREGHSKTTIKGITMRTAEDVYELGLYANDCCNEELIFDEGDTFSRCPRCHSLCNWKLEASITRVNDLEDESMAKKSRYALLTWP